MCCLHPMESNHHLMHACTHEGIMKSRQIVHDAIVKYVREAHGSTLLQQVISQMFEIDDNGKTVLYSRNNIPEEWMEAYNECPDQGHKYVSTMMRGLAAEVVLQLGNTQLLWRGIIPHSLVKLFHMGDIPFDQIRKLTRQIRTILHQGSNTIWKHRNKMNFAEKIEAERFLHQKELTKIRAHIESNDKAKLTGQSVEQIMSMPLPERHQWMYQTKDPSSKQHGIDEIFPYIDDEPQPIQTKPLPTLQEIILVQKTQSSTRQPKLDLPTIDKPARTPVPGRLSQSDYKQLLKTHGKRKKILNKEYEAKVQKHSSQSTEPITRTKRKAISHTQADSPNCPSSNSRNTGTKKSRGTKTRSTSGQSHQQIQYTPDGGGSGVPTENRFSCLHQDDDTSYDEYLNDIQQDSPSDSEESHSTDLDDYVEETETRHNNTHPPQPRRRRMPKRKSHAQQQHRRKLAHLDDSDSEEDHDAIMAWADQQHKDLDNEEALLEPLRVRRNGNQPAGAMPQQTDHNAGASPQHVEKPDDSDPNESHAEIMAWVHKEHTDLDNEEARLESLRLYRERTQPSPHPPSRHKDNQITAGATPQQVDRNAGASPQHAESSEDDDNDNLRCNRKRKRAPHNPPDTTDRTQQDPDTGIPIDRMCSAWKKKRK
jgi:hypothetical protein